MGVLRARAATAAIVAFVAVLLGACDAAPESPSSPPRPSTAGLGGPSISMDATWQVLDGRWTFSGRVDPRGAETRVFLDVGYDVTDPTAFEESITVAGGIVDPGPVQGSMTTPDAEMFCVRFRAENADGDAVTPRQCFPTDLPGSAPSASPGPVESPSAEPS